MSRPDPLFFLTLLGLIGSGAIVTLHPPEPLRADAADHQVGRSVTVDLIVLESTPGEGWWRGRATPLEHPTQVVPWVWFRPPDAGPLVGDRVVGRALVEREGAGIGLVLDGSAAALVLAGPAPVPVHWDDLLRRPALYAGRLLELNGIAVGTTLLDPTGIERCALEDGVEAPLVGRLLVRIEPVSTRLGWRCQVEGIAA